MTLAPHQIRILNFFSANGKRQLIRFGAFGRYIIWPETNPNGPRRGPTSSQGLGMRASAEINKLCKIGLLHYAGPEEDRGPGTYFYITATGVSALDEMEASRRAIARNEVKA